jgi:hypothetical protein
MKTVNPEWKKSDSAAGNGNAPLQTIVVAKAGHKRFDELMGDPS